MYCVSGQRLGCSCNLLNLGPNLICRTLFVMSCCELMSYVRKIFGALVILNATCGLCGT